MPTNSKPILTAPMQTRFGFQVSIRWLVFASLLLASVPPILGLYKWMERNAIQKEIAYVEENHLIIALNLADAMERFANYVALIFELTANSLETSKGLDLSNTLDNFDLRFVAIVDSNNAVVKEVNATDARPSLQLRRAQIAGLRSLAAADPGRSVFSGIQLFDGSPHMFLTRIQSNGTLAIAALKPRYLIELQRSIKFGARGHSMMVDQNGLVIAHPNSEWEVSSKDASKLSVVQKMMAGEIGVATFYSPPMQADMISGFTFVERTGWGVMVPQPMSELVARAKASEVTAFAIVMFEISAIIMVSWWLSSLITIPIRNVVTTAEAVSSGDLEARVTMKSGRVVISEAQLLGASFNQVIQDLQSDRNQLTIALDAANEGTRAKLKFLTVMSHEVRTPMHGLMGVLDLIEEGKLDDDQRHLLAVGIKAAKNMVVILNGVLNFVKLESDAESSRASAFSPADLVQGIVDLFQPLASQKGLSLTSSVSDQVVNGDSQMIYQILLNLVGNAVKFTNEGQIHIASQIHDAGTRSERFILSVTDSGIGIAEDFIETVFEEFTQVDSDLTRIHEGSGLGLAISSNLAQLMNGKITLTSEPNKGSRFELNIPATMGNF